MPANEEWYSRPRNDEAVSAKYGVNLWCLERHSTHGNAQHEGDETRPMGEADTWEVVLTSTMNNSANDEDEDLEVHWNGTDDPGKPRNFPLIQRWPMVIIISLCSLCIICSSAAYPMAYGQITVAFNCSKLVANLGLSLFIMGLGVGPLFLAPLSDFMAAAMYT
ncbi:hypothetical protein AJ78_02051 [Emergomyces pasteurianus Ep9510]|uniref:Major facilitator superfamily (MFS) profile domain-containing protein n=1 Tax=Emergomyces pasteurianus Ep9510 TaxID=1447872 RepID=A0A1J9QNX0_9EURO|nr:hypothetical protein AJ78_02051 [Emergomyces pasteurianus Ep9510]